MWGLPYAIDASLWRVRALEPTLLRPFDEQNQHCTAMQIPAREQRHILRRFTIERAVTGWTPGVAERFVTATASRLRVTLLRALSDAWSVVDGAESRDLWSMPAPPEDATFELVGRLVALYREASHACAAGDLLPAARSVGHASAEARELSARRFAAALSNRPAIVGEGFLEARRWQARLLASLVFGRTELPGTIEGSARDVGGRTASVSAHPSVAGAEPGLGLVSSSSRRS